MGDDNLFDLEIWRGRRMAEDARKNAEASVGLRPSDKVINFGTINANQQSNQELTLIICLILHIY